MDQKRQGTRLGSCNPGNQIRIGLHPKPSTSNGSEQGSNRCISRQAAFHELTGIVYQNLLVREVFGRNTRYIVNQVVNQLGELANPHDPFRENRASNIIGHSMVLGRAGPGLWHLQDKGKLKTYLSQNRF